MACHALKEEAGDVTSQRGVTTGLRLHGRVVSRHNK